MKNKSFIQQPRKIVISQVSKISNEAYSNQHSPANTNKYKSFHLPAISNQKRHGRYKTQIETSINVLNQQVQIQANDKDIKKSTRIRKMTPIIHQLTKKISILNKMGLIQGGAVKTVIYSGHIRKPTVHNDYHNSKTNAGYSRNKFGGIFPK